jgi:hypothetical protein
MPGKGTAPKSGDELKRNVVALAQRMGLKAETEVKAARRLWGQKRYIDVVITDEKTGKRLGVECKYQATSGTAEEKIPATIQDIAHWPIPGIVVIDGEGFSSNMQGYLMSTGKVVWYEELEEWLRLYFGL